jgi:hypothetical protein
MSGLESMRVASDERSKHLVIRFSFVLLAALAASPLAADDYPPGPMATGEAEPLPPKPFYLITDYLPVAIYQRDNVVGSFRVENTTGAAARLELVATAYDVSGNVVNEQTKGLAAPSSGFGQVQASQDSVGVAKVRFALREVGRPAGSPGEPAARPTLADSVTVRLLRDEDTWPQTEFRAGRLVVADTKELLVPVVEKRKKYEDRAFAPVKWLLGSAPIVRFSGKALAFIPGRWALKSDSPPETVLLGPYRPNGAPPVLRAASEILNKLLAENASRDEKAEPLAQLLICLPPEEFDVSTDPRVYRAVVETLLTHLAIPSLKKVLVVPPFQYGAAGKYCEALWREVREAALACGASVVDPADCLDERLWRVNPAAENVYGNRPNAAGLKKIEQGLLNLVR